MHDLEELEPGSSLGSYKIISLLREGGMGRIYVAEHTLLGRQVALKVLRPQYSANPYAVSRFFAEARAVNRISHENIVEITDFCENGDGHNYLIMELLKGQDLADLLLKVGVVPINRAVDIAVQTADALTAVHEGRIIHRDLKPDNIFLIDRASKLGFVKLLDFGVAKLTDPNDAGIQMGTTAEGAIIGTPEYMSPEQATGEQVDQRSDIYSLGVILYEMVTGMLPFRANNFGELVVQLMTVEPKPPRSYAELAHEIPVALDQLIMDMLARKARDRPQSMREVETRLRLIQNELMPFISDPISARLRRPSEQPPSVVTTRSTRITTSRPPRRRRVVIATATALAALVSVGWFALPASDSSTAHSARPLVVRAPSSVLVAARPVAFSPVPVAPPPQSVDAEVAIEFRSTPSGAAVREKGSHRIVGTTPFVYRFPRSDAVRTFEFQRAGFKGSTQDVKVSSDGAIAVALGSAVPATPKPHVVAPANVHVDRNSTMKVFDE